MNNYVRRKMSIFSLSLALSPYFPPLSDVNVHFLVLLACSRLNDLKREINWKWTTLKYRLCNDKSNHFLPTLALLLSWARQETRSQVRRPSVSLRMTTPWFTPTRIPARGGHGNSVDQISSIYSRRRDASSSAHRGVDQRGWEEKHRMVFVMFFLLQSQWRMSVAWRDIIGRIFFLSHRRMNLWLIDAFRR